MMPRARIIVWLFGLLVFVTLCYKIYYYAYSFPIRHDIKIPGSFADSVSLKVVDSISLKLDNVTSPGVIWNIVPMEQDNNFVISFINLVTRDIYVYDLAKEDIAEVWRMDSIGFRRSDFVQGFNFLSKDSIFVYTFTGSKWTLLSRDKGKISQGSLAIGEYSPYPNMYPYVSTSSPLVYDKISNNIYFVNHWESRGTKELDELESVLGKLDIKTGEFSSELKFPEEYMGINWGGIAGVGRESHSFDMKRGLLTISYMFDDSLILYQPLLKKVQRVYAGSKFFNERTSLDFHPALIDLNKDRIENYYERSFSYTAIIYDSFRNKYYRITDFPTESRDANVKGKNSIIIMDGNHTLLGEVVLQSRYNVKNCFVSEKGLYIQRSDYHNDDFLKFDCFRPIKAKK